MTSFRIGEAAQGVVDKAIADSACASPTAGRDTFVSLHS
jgi:hypothetical protein